MARLRLDVPHGASAETRAAFAALEVSLGSYVASLEQRLAALEVQPAGFQVKSGNFTARAGQIVTVEPPPTGLTVTLPAASAVTRRARVVVTSKNANAVRWEAAGGLVNGARQVTSNAPGAIEAICDGEAWHVSVGSATPNGSAASTAGATFFLEEADTGLPHARVADDSTEVDLDYTSPGIVSWFLKTASVAFSKLADLTGLSVLGRAANSSGVMAAITASGARQVLRANDAGTALEWAHPVRVSDSGSDVGDFFDLNFVDGTGTFVAASDAGSGRASVQVNWHGLYVFDNASFVDYFQGLRFDDGTGTVAVVTDTSPTGVVRFDWDGVTNLVTGWDGVLAIGNSSGANDVQIDASQHLNFGATGPTTSNPQIRSGDDTFRIRGSGNVFVLADGSIAALASTAASSTAVLQAQGTGSTAQVSGAESVVIDTGGSVRLEVTVDGAWELAGDPGASGEVLTSQGAGAPPIWATVDLSSVTYSAGDGLDLSGTTFSVDASDFAGTGIEDDGSNNLRIAASAAGNGLTGGGGSALAVGAGTRITVNADDVQLAAGAADSFLMNATSGTAVADYRAGTSVAGDGLNYTSGGTLSVDADDLDGAGLGVDGSNNLVYTGTNSGVDLGSVSGSLGVIDISSTFASAGGASGAAVTITAATGDYTIDGFTVPPNDGWTILFCDRRTGSESTPVGTIANNAGNTSTSIRCPQARDMTITPGCTYAFTYQNGRWRPVAHSGLFGLIKRDTVVTNTSWASTQPAGATHFRLYMAGAGGGSGGVDADSNPEVCAAAGGGSGAVVDLFLSAVDGETQITGTTGNPGSGGTASGGNGTAGGNSTATYNSVVYTAGGGAAGAGTAAGANTTNRAKATAPGAGGTTSEAQLSRNGNSGEPGLMICGEATAAHSLAIGGRGGDSPLAQGGIGGIMQGTAGSAPGTAGRLGSGGGGPARISTGSTTGQAGASGGTGWAVVEWYKAL